MNYDDGIVDVNKVNDLEIPVRARLSANQAFLIVHSCGAWRSRKFDDEFGFLRLDAVLTNLVAIPFNPAEFVRHAWPSFPANKVYT